MIRVRPSRKAPMIARGHRNSRAALRRPRLAGGAGIALAVLLGAIAPLAGARPPAGGITADAHAFADTLAPETWAKIAGEARRNEAKLAQEGKLLPRGKVAGMIWPLAPNPGAGVALHGVSNFVDLNAAFPNQLRDYQCEARTYDNAQGYNHGGTDVFIWPYPWTLMAEGAVDIVAAAPGTIVGRADGNDDRSCSFDAPDTPNYVLVRHADGTMAVYLHMKRGSVTTAAIGSTVAAGDYLGKVGSSGISTGPHLHFELRASTANNAAVIDPFTGPCNTRPTGWAQQRPYREPRINRVAAHSRTPEFAACPNANDTPHFTGAYRPGDRAIFSVAYRDQTRDAVTQLRLVRPDGSVAEAFDFSPAESGNPTPVYNGSLWFFDVTIPATAPTGTWAFEATYSGETHRTTFVVNAAGAATIADPRGLTGAWFDPATSGQGAELQWVEGDRLLVLFYGHHDDGENFYVIGTRDGRFDYGQTLTIPLSSTRGGRFNGLDPNAIVRAPWGTMSLRFDSCSAATATLAGLDGTQTLALQPLTRGPGLRCE